MGKLKLPDRAPDKKLKTGIVDLPLLKRKPYEEKYQVIEPLPDYEL